MRVQIIGCNGSMGRRYQAILNFCQLPQSTHMDLNFGAIDPEATHYIIATPTPTHKEILMSLPIRSCVMCEKPLSCRISDVDEMLAFCYDKLVDFRMTLQYVRLFSEDMIRRMQRHLRTKTTVVSSYDYYNHGKDGLVWDCLQTIALARDEVTLGETSPLWNCTINDVQLSTGREMDIAYIEEVEGFVYGNPPQYFNLIDRKLSYYGWLREVHVKADKLCQQL